MAALEHMGLGPALKQFAPRVNVIVLMMATELLDLLWGLFTVLGLDKMSFSPWSHSLLMALVWSLVAGLIAGAVYKELRSALIIGLLVFSHWIVDFITHPMGFIFPGDVGMPLSFSPTPAVGLGLYNTLPGVICGWLILVVPGTVMYIRYRRNKKNA